jgi:hypothetical protein
VAGWRTAKQVQEVTGERVEVLYADQGYTGEDPQEHLHLLLQLLDVGEAFAHPPLNPA